MFAASVGTAQLAWGAAYDASTGLHGACERAEVALYYASFTISNAQPCGEYRLEARASSVGTATSLTSYFDVVCFYYLQFDFDRVDWGTIQSGLPHTLEGDLVFGGPATNAPTIRNVGNDGLALSVSLLPLVRSDPGGNQVSGAQPVDRFSACFGRVPTTLQCGVPAGADGSVHFDQGRDHVLCANEVGRLDLSIQAAPGAPEGQYVGSLQLRAKPAPQIC
jgi:hypothetical protein